MWMDLESFIRSKVSQKEKSKYMFIFYTWNLKSNTDELVSVKRPRDTVIENKCVDTQGGWGRWDELF